MRSQAAPLFVSCLAKERARREPVQSRKAIVIARREAGGFRPGLWVFHQGGNGRLPIKCRIAFRGGPVPRLRKTPVPFPWKAVPPDSATPLRSAPKRCRHRPFPRTARLLFLNHTGNETAP